MLRYFVVFKDKESQASARSGPWASIQEAEKARRLLAELPGVKWAVLTEGKV